MCFKRKMTYHDSSDWLDYMLLADGYFEAAEIVNGDKGFTDNHGLIMPLIYLLKHAIELSLKKILKFDFLLSNKKLKTHDLKKLNKIFMNKTRKIYNKKLKNLWDEVAKDRLQSDAMSFSDFINNFNDDVKNFLNKSGFVNNDRLNQEQRYPFGEYSEPTEKIINIFFNDKDVLVELASKVTIGIDIIYDFILRTKKSRRATAG